jgi:Glycosyltransferases involved in cell wall biogenesis
MVEVSVVIPSFNYGRFIERAVTSVTGQSFADIEVLVVDNASRDETLDIVERLSAADARIRLLRNEENRGIAASRNLGIAAAVGEWVTFLDADDWYDSERIRSLLDTTRAEGCEFAADNQFFIEDGCETPWRMMLECEPEGVMGLDLDGFIDLNRLGFGDRTTIGLIKPFIRRRVLSDSRILYRNDLPLCEDLDFELRLLEYLGRMVLVKRPLYFYRQHGGSATAANGEAVLLNNLRVTYAALERQCLAVQSPTRDRLARRAAKLEHALACRKVINAVRSRRPLTTLKEILRQPDALVSIAAGAARHARRTAKQRVAGRGVATE